MPSVGMRRTTRVFGVVKGVDGARVLRSGRRVWIGPGDSKLKRGSFGDEWLHTMLKSNNGSLTKCNKENGWTHTKNQVQNQTHISKLKKEVSKKVNQSVRDEVEKVNDCKSNRYGIVYIRKRKRSVDGVEKQQNLNDSDNDEKKKFGIQFSRRQRRRLSKGIEIYPSRQSALLGVVVDNSSTTSRELGLVASFLHLVFSYIWRTNLSVSELAGFLSTQMVSSAFGSSGIRFLRDTSINISGICKIFGAGDAVPVFSVDFFAVPLCFMYMHFRLAFRVGCLSLEPVNNSADEDSCDESMSGSEEHHPGGLIKTGTLENKLLLHPSMRTSRLVGRHNQHRSGLNSRGIRKRRSSFRRKKARNPSVVVMNKTNGVLVSDLVCSRKNGVPLSHAVSRNRLRRSVCITPTVNLKEASSAVVEVGQTMDSSRCSANVLVIYSDRCYRIAGATVALEIGVSKEWVLAVKKDGLTKFTHLAQKNMRPCSSNRITHDIIWTGDDSWKLEFPDRQDWLNFKDLYKECSDRNVPVTVSKSIPVPGVCEVIEYADSSSLPFSRPDAYISVSKDEVARALAKSTANYDMDSEDDEWLKKFNSELILKSERQGHLSEENFELMIDAFERALYSSPDDFTDEKAAVNICIDLGRKEAIEAVYGYWMKKRKQRRSSLLRVFQLNQGKKASVIPKPGLRKRRSFKRQASQGGRGKQPSLLQSMAAEHNALEEQNAMRNVEAAKAAAKLSFESAVLKRRQAQMLMDNADLAVYKAVMALRIAEAACCSIPTDVAEMHFLD